MSPSRVPAPARPVPAAAARPRESLHVALEPLPPQALETCRAIGRLFDASREVVLTTHVNPDGDGLGAEAALAAYLVGRGVRVRILNPDPAPRKFAFLDTPAAPFGVYAGGGTSVLAGADAVVVLDTGVVKRLGPVAEALPGFRGVRVCIDHHEPRAPVGDLNLVDPGVSSTAELVYRLLEALGAELVPAIAVPLYVGILFDTGCFRYSNTTPQTHLVAAELLRHGADVEDLYRRLFASHSAARMRLWGRALAGLVVEAGGRLAWMAVDRTLIAETDATPEELEGLVEQGRQVEGVELAILFREDSPSLTKVSFRSHGDLDVNALAGRFGGGGHVNAAGANLPGSWLEACDRVLTEARRYLAEWDARRPGTPGRA